jgi:hypothetical protein
MRETDPKMLIAYILYLQSWVRTDEDFEEMSNEFFTELREKWEQEWVPAITSEHSGDCTQQPWSCIRCWWDNTLKFAERILNA